MCVLCSARSMAWDGLTPVGLLFPGLLLEGTAVGFDFIQACGARALAPVGVGSVGSSQCVSLCPLAAPASRGRAVAVRSGSAPLGAVITAVTRIAVRKWCLLRTTLLWRPQRSCVPVTWYTCTGCSRLAALVHSAHFSSVFLTVKANSKVHFPGFLLMRFQ